MAVKLKVTPIWIPADPKECHMHPPLLWAGLVRMMSGKPQTLAPMGSVGNYAEYSKRIAAEVAESTAQLKEFNDSLLLYYKQLADTWF